MPLDLTHCYRRYGPMVLRRCRTLLGDEARAEDVMHDVFVALARREASLTDSGLSSLLYRMATQRCLNRLRDEGRRREDPGEALIMRLACAEELEARSQARIFLDKVFGTELESTRTIATLHLLDGMTLEEVAATVGMSVSGVRKRLRGLASQVRELEGV